MAVIKKRIIMDQHYLEGGAGQSTIFGEDSQIL